MHWSTALQIATSALGALAANAPLAPGPAMPVAFNFSNVREESAPIMDGFQTRKHISRKWGEFSPFYSVAPGAADSPRIPRTCKVTFLQVLSRHGARSPTTHDAKNLMKLTSKLTDAIMANVKADSFYLCKLDEKYRFLVNYTYNLGADELTDFGREELSHSGAKVRYRYAKLIEETGAIPFIRAAGQSRVVESAEWFANGYAKQEKTDKTKQLYVQVLPETQDSPDYNPLSNAVCYDAWQKNVHTNISDYILFNKTWMPQSIQRFKDDLNITFAPQEIISLMNLCPYHTVSMSTTHEGQKVGELSPFCNLFRQDEWDNYDYYRTLWKYWFFGPGGKYGAVSGNAWVRELIARLTNTTDDDNQSGDPLFNKDPKIFPLGLPLYADFSHDDSMLMIFAAMGLFDKYIPPKTDVHTESNFKSSEVTPFAARMYVEKLKCENENNGEEVVRVILNDKVMHLGCKGSIEGRCPLNKFVDKMKARVNNAKNKELWDQCVNLEEGRESKG